MSEITIAQATIIVSNYHLHMMACSCQNKQLQKGTCGPYMGEDCSVESVRNRFYYSICEMKLGNLHEKSLRNETWDRLPGRSNGIMSPKSHQCSDVSSELCCQALSPRRRAPPLVTRFGVIPREKSRFHFDSWC